MVGTAKACRSVATTIIARSVVQVALGFVIGSALAGPAAKVLSFQKATLFDVMRRLHSGVGPDIAWNGSDKTAQTFDLDSSTAGNRVAAAAKKYGRDAVNVRGVICLESRLPDVPTGVEKMSVLKTYLYDELPTSVLSDGRRTSDFYAPFFFSSQKLQATVYGQLSPGEYPFSKLSPEQKEMTLDLLQRSHMTALMSGLRSGVLNFAPAGLWNGGKGGSSKK